MHARCVCVYQGKIDSMSTIPSSCSCTLLTIPGLQQDMFFEPFGEYRQERKKTRHVGDLGYICKGPREDMYGDLGVEM